MSVTVAQRQSHCLAHSGSVFDPWQIVTDCSGNLGQES